MEEGVECLVYAILSLFYTQKLEIFGHFQKLKRLKFEFPIKVITIFVKSLKNTSSGMFTLFVSQ